MKYLSLFSGIGGFERGIQQAYESNIKHAFISKESEQKERTQRWIRSIDKHGILLHTGDGSAPLCIGYSEIDKYASKVYQHHFPEHYNYGDITKINAEELPDFDLLVGGFPCQAFSIAGKRKGFDDTRGTLFFDIARILRAKQPRLFLLENVKGLLSHDNGNTFRTIISTLTDLGYDLQWQVLNSKNHGVPQNRERIFIVGHLRGTRRPQVFPFGIANENNTDKTEKLREPISNTLRTNYSNGKSNETYIGETEELKIRRLTPTECERLQGFPDGWTGVENTSDSQRYKMCGNAVTVNVIRDIMEKLLTPSRTH